MRTRAADTASTTADETSLTTALKDVAEHGSAIARLELKLALLEVKEKVSAVGVGIGLAIAGVVFALFALGFGGAALAAAIATTLPTWLALVLVTGAFLLLACALGLLGLRSIKSGTPPVPEQAIEEAKLTTEAIKSNGHERSTS